MTTSASSTPCARLGIAPFKERVYRDKELAHAA